MFFHAKFTCSVHCECAAMQKKNRCFQTGVHYWKSLLILTGDIDLNLIAIKKLHLSEVRDPSWDHVFSNVTKLLSTSVQIKDTF